MRAPRPSRWAGLALAVTFAWCNDAIAQSAPSAFTSATRYDLEHRPTGTIAPDPDGAGPLNFPATRTTYDAAGRVTRVETGELASWQSEAVAPASWSGFTVFSQVDTSYDARDRKLTERASAGGVGYTLTQYSYDTSGRLECIAVRMNPAAYGSLPTSACTLGAQGSDGPDRITRNVYDAAGQLLKVQKAVGTDVQADYANYTYSPNGKQTSVTDANGNRAALTYDGFDRQNGWYFPDKVTIGAVSTTDYEAYGYDANGNRTSLRKRDGRVLSYTYDALNRVTSVIIPDGCAPIQAGPCPAAAATRDVYYGYDLRGLQLYARFDSSGGEGIANSYDGFGRLASSTTTMGGATRTLSYQYDANDNLTRLTYPDQQFVNYYRDGLDRLHYADLNSATGLFHTPHNAAGQVSALYRSNPSCGWCTLTGFAYDGVQRLSAYSYSLGSTSYNQSTSFTYNPASQITSKAVSSNAYAFRGHYNVNRAYSVNGLNQYTAAGPASFSYDANGNLIGDGTNAYGYDAENRLVSGPNGTTLSYDPQGRLWQVAGASGVTRFLYDGDQLTAEYGTAGNMLRRYVHGPGADDPQVWYEGASTATPRYLFADHQGSVAAITDVAGTVSKINTYDAYGIPGADNATITQGGRFQYTGQAWLPELGMYHYKARIYSPTLGRFLQTDPIGYKDQVNLYAYVANDPVNGRDPSGKRIVVQGTRNERLQLRASISAVARSNTASNARFNELISSKNVHTVTPARGGNFSQNRAQIPVEAENGKGTSTTSFIEMVGAKSADGVAFDINTLIAHELFGHAYDADKGQSDSSVNPTTGIERREESGVKAENEYRSAVGDEERLKYGDKPLKPEQ